MSAAAMKGSAVTDTSVPTPDRILELGYSFRNAKALLSAVELGVFTELADRPLTLEELANRVEIRNRGSRDFFDALVALGLLCRDEHGRYANTPETAQYLDRRKPTYIGGTFEHLGARNYGFWNSLTPALRTGEPQSGTRATGNYPALYADRSALENFVKGMTGFSLPVARALAQRSIWDSAKTVIDIGGAQGCVPAEIALIHSHITGGSFDLPPVASLFESYVSKYGLSDRLRFYPGDFFRDPFPAADVLIMGRVLHNWDLANRQMLLTKAFDALPPGGALLVYEQFVDDERRANAGALLSSLNMLIMSAGGCNFTISDCITWMHGTGFRDMRIEPLAAEQSAVIGIK